ncbi:MAG: hypothetical protein PVF96_05600 [Candidatus Bathyarchaeota archaeon]
MVEKRTLTFVTLATLVWAVSISSLAGFFYLQNTSYQKQIEENNQLLHETDLRYNELINKRNVLQSDYSIIYGSFSFPNANLTSLMTQFSSLIKNLKGNYSHILGDQESLNLTFYTLQERYNTLEQGGNITTTDFEGLLNDWDKIFDLLAIKELSTTISQIVMLKVSICIDYGNTTLEWRNQSATPAGSSLLDLTEKIATIDVKYQPLMEPGHIFLTSINGESEWTGYNPEEGYSEGSSWIWYHLDNTSQLWISGTVGCDAWTLQNNGVYKWSFEYWHWP